MTANARTALVTGASRGIGRAIAGRLAEDGFDVAFTYSTDADGAAETASAIEATGRKALALQADVRDSGAVDKAFDEIAERLGPVAALVNNAGVRHDNLAVRSSDEQWLETIDVNLTGAFNCSRAALRGMMRERWGRIVMISSVTGLHGNAGQAAYGASKAGMIGLARTLAKEYARKQITVNSVAPGPVETAMTEGVMEKIVAAVPAGRAGTVEEVAAAVSFLVSDQAAYITGAVLPVDGGMTA
ncbi:MAG TPA: 3-oxoacyl-ACP reductase FabG [Solirubrobacterales bacterium]|nr:3-oxoacyl-ACP reductase FabG [Solirubrobacterales bacterium]